MYNPDAKTILNIFCEKTNSEMLCHKICGQHFHTVEDHTEYVKNGGCAGLIDALAKA
jgi:hypothetical protein